MMILEIEDDNFEEIRGILGSLYLKNKQVSFIDEEVLRLSQWIDDIVVHTQKERQVVYAKANN